VSPVPSQLARKAGSVLLALSLAAAPLRAPLAQVRQPSLGEAVSEDFGVGTEKRVGEQIMREIRRDPDYLDDPVQLEYVQSLWQATPHEFVMSHT